METKRRTLSQIETFKLMGLIEKDYTERKETDSQFAVYACAALTLTGINSKHVERARASLGIPATLYSRTVASKAQQELILEALQQAEKRLCNLELKMESVEKVLAAYKALFPNIRV